MTSSGLLRGRELAVWHGQRCLFERLDFELGPSQLALLVGANGTGKTTLAKHLAQEYSANGLPGYAPFHSAVLRFATSSHTMS